MDGSKIFIAGANGQLGTALRQKYPNAQSADIDQMDITNRDSVLGYNWSNIDAIINAAAFTNVDAAETPEGRVAAWRVNAQAVAHLVEAAQVNNLTLVHVSTEYVFDGTKDNHAVNEPYSPLGVYAQTKAASEIVAGLTPKHYIFRISWLIGEGHNFVRTMMGLAEKNVSPTVVADQVGRLTFTPTLVDVIDHALRNQIEFGIYNVSNDGDPASWADITRLIFEYMGRKDLKVTDTTTAEYFASKPESSPRPLKSAMDLTKIKSSGAQLSDWHSELKNYVDKEMEKK
ncbi:MAG TPA: NAD(P)-dependent oxidoreductase [Candidatus Saccharimonadales bacterium]|nr:NAD(P)-dependent oxidoreductase [Candidatus Saccharimonadales bacterium]